MTRKEEKQKIKKDGKYIERTYVYDELKGGHPLEISERDLTPEEVAIEEEKNMQQKRFREEAFVNMVTLEKLDAKLNLILQKLEAK